MCTRPYFMFDHKRRNDINENATLKRNIVQESKMEKEAKGNIF